MARFAPVLLVLPLFSGPLQAHLLKVFAAAEGDRIDGSVYYAGGAKAEGAAVVIRTPEGRVLAELSTDADGGFVFAASEHIDHLITAETPEGHLGSWTVPAGELAGEMPTPVGIAVPSATGAAGTGGMAGAAGPPRSSLETLVEGAVARQIRPLRAQILAHEDRVRLRDLLGAIGYIVGVVGVVLWWRTRRETRDA